jgi:hypothetical protein
MLVHPQFSPVAFSVGPFSVAGLTLGPLEVRWYGLMYLLGFILFVVLGRWRGGKYLKPILMQLQKIPFMERWMQRASRAALEKQNPELASAVSTGYLDEVVDLVIGLHQGK